MLSHSTHQDCVYTVISVGAWCMARPTHLCVYELWEVIHLHYKKKVYLLLQYKCCTSVVYVIFDHVVYTCDKVCM